MTPGARRRAVACALAWLMISVGVSARAQGGTPAREVSFATSDGATVVALERGDGPHAVVLAHGKVFDKESWDPLDAALAARGLRVLAIDFRGYGRSGGGSESPGLYRDVLGAAAYLRASGAERVSLLGASMGGGAVARAASLAAPGSFDAVVLLSPVPFARAERVQGRKLVIVSRDEPLAGRLRAVFDRLRGPKRFVALEGAAHAQHILATARRDELVDAVAAFLLAAPDASGGRPDAETADPPAAHR